MPRALPALAAVVAALLVLPAGASAAQCSGDPADVRPIALTVAGQPATGLYTVPAAPPRGLVVFGHGAANTSDSWRRHLVTVAQREGVIAVAMDYRGMEITGRHEERGTVTARGWPAKAGGEDLVAAAQHFDRTCPGLAGIVLYGVSMGGNMTGLAMAAQAKRSDGRPLFDYWIAVEGVHNLVETYQEARAVAPAVAFARTTVEDIEKETGGPFETHGDAFAERTNLNRVPDVAGSGVRGVILVHAYEDGTVPYNQSQEMTQRLRQAGVPTDLYSVGGRGSDEPDTTIGGYAGVQSGNAGHGWEGSDTHVVIQTGFDRLNALLTRGEPAPCDRDFRVDEQPSNVSPDPKDAPAECKPDPLPPPPPAGSPGGPGGPGGGATAQACRDTQAPARVAFRVRRRGRRVVVRGRATDRGCGRISRVAVSIARRQAGRRCRFVTRRGRLSRPRSCRRRLYIAARGRESWRLRVRRPLRRGRYVVRAFAIDEAGLSGPRGRAKRFRIR
jgi:pimeloyl-ACP methyl ester carboxylesterase